MNVSITHRTFARLFSLFLLLFILPNVSAEPNVIGVFSGTLSGFRDQCFISPPGPASSNSVNLNITSQTGPSFSGTFTVSGLTSGGTVSGTINNAGAMTGTFSGANIAGFSFSGTFNGSTLVIAPQALSVEDLSMNCFDLGGTLNFSGGTVIDPTIAPGTTIKDSGTIQSEILGIVAPIQQHLVKTLHGIAKGLNIGQEGFLLEGESGLNAGDIQIGDIGVWVSYNYREVENDFAATAFESDSHTVISGVDYTPNDNLVMGIALAYENSDTDTTFNGGNLESDGFTVVPYLGVLLNDTWSVDASMGFSFIENDQFRIDPTTLARVSSSPDTDRFFAAVNLNGITYHDNWILGGRFGYLFAKTETDNFTESNGTVVGERRTKLGQIRIGGDIAYSYQDWEPYFSATYEYDSSFDEIVLVTGPQPANDRDDVLLAAGFRYFNQAGLSANFEYSKRVLREDFDEDSLTFSLRYDY